MAIDPRPAPRDYDQLDFRSLTDRVVEQLPFPWGLEREDLEIHPFVGGAYLVHRGMESVVAFADGQTAVVRGPLLERGFAIVQLEQP